MSDNMPLYIRTLFSNLIIKISKFKKNKLILTEKPQDHLICHEVPESENENFY